MSTKIAYVMSRFPHLPETFILREMEELERQGWEIALVPLVVQSPKPGQPGRTASDLTSERAGGQAVIHLEARPWIDRAHQISVLSGDTLCENVRMLARHPRRYLSMWLQMVVENLRSPKFLVRALYLFPKAVRMARIMQQEGIRHIHAHYATHPALVAWLVSGLTGISYSVTVHAHDIFVEKAMLATKLRGAAFIVAISEFNREHLARLFGPWVREKTCVIHCGIRPEQFHPRLAPDLVESEASPSHSRAPFEILNIGSLQPYKGQQYLIEACAELRRQNIPFRCRIIGGGEERPRLERLIRELHLETRVELLGPRTQGEVAELLPSADCYVQPSIITPSGKMEGIPVALMEAMACGVPCIATRLSGVPELVKDGKTGWLVPPANVPALADRLASIYFDPAGAERVAQAGRRLVLEEFDLVSNVRKLGGLFESVGAGFTPAPTSREPVFIAANIAGSERETDLP